MSIISASGINKSFRIDKRNSLHVLKDISIDVEENKITVLIGASGAGKSTLLHLLGGLDKPDSGIISIKNTEVTKLRDKELSAFRNREVGFVFQFHHLLPEFTAFENIAMAGMIHGKKLKDMQEPVEELLKIVGLTERKDHKPSELSGGEQQRVALARAMINKPGIIFADEPTGNLDSKNSEEMNELFTRLRDEFNTTLLLVTHNPGLMEIGDRVIEMKDGRII